MRPYLIVVGLLFLVTGCKFACDVEKVVADGLGDKLYQGMVCKNPTQVKTDVLKLIDQAKLCDNAKECEGKKQGVIANIVCPLVSKAGVALLGQKVPDSWECNPQAGPLPDLLTEYCKLLPF